MSRSVRAAHFAFWFLALPVALTQADPRIGNLSLRGLQIGGKTTVVIDGAELMPQPVLVGSFPIAAQTLKSDTAKANQIEIEVELNADALPGIYELRVASEHGVSNAILVGIDQLPQAPFAETVPSLPIAMHGTLTGTQVLSTKFQGKKGQSFVADLEARRIGSKLNPILRIKDHRGRQIGWSPARKSIEGDARVGVTLPEDGEYSVEIHDLLFRGAAPGHFRLKLGELHYADLAFPLAVQAGQKSPVSFDFSNLPPEHTVELDASSIALPTTRPAPLQHPNFTGSRPQVQISQHAEFVESAPAADGSKQLLGEAPVAVSGRLMHRKEEDQYLVPVKAGSKLRVQVQAQKFGSPLDGVIVVRNPAGGDLASNDDRPGEPDPGVEVQVPEGVSQLLVAVRDLLGRGGDDFVYRVEVTDATAPDIGVTLESDRVNIGMEGTRALKLEVTRQNYAGPIQLVLEGLPPGVQVHGDLIPAGATLGLVTLTASQARGHGLVKVIARGIEAPVKLERFARTAATRAAEETPWRNEELAVAATLGDPIRIAWSGTVDGPMLLGEKLPLTVEVLRMKAAQGKVRLRLLTTQVMPRKKVKENNQEKEVDDTDRALRLEGDVIGEADSKQVTGQLLIPADLAAQDYGLVIAADLLGADDKTVRMTATTTVLMKKPVVPFSVELATKDAVEAKAGGGDTGKLTGKIHRHAGFTKPVALSLDGLPKEYSSPTVTVEADKTDFEFPVRFAYGAPPAELKEAKLIARYAPDSKNAELVVKSDPVSVSAIKVVPGEPPPAAALHMIFEDDEKFLAFLSKGSGVITLETGAKHTGTASVKVTPDQRYHEQVPNLNLKIREKPGPGEFRYLRYAWKKQGGAAICLQLNHDGAWGPGAGTKEGAKFRYHAGSGGECYGASLLVDEKLPAEFVVVTRDLFADFGEFTLTGLALSPVDGEFALFDGLYLAREMSDFEPVK